MRGFSNRHGFMLRRQSDDKMVYLTVALGMVQAQVGYKRNRLSQI